MGEEEIERRRKRLELFFKLHLPLTRNAICKKAKASESTVGAFLRGGKRAPRFLTDDTYLKLSDWSDWTIAELKGEAPEPSPEDIASRKNAKSVTKVSDSLTTIRHPVPRTSDSPESEGQMEDQLRLDLVDKIWIIPADRLEGLAKHIEAIERAVGQLPRPQQRGKTGL
jgi:hypothetical protein